MSISLSYVISTVMMYPDGKYRLYLHPVTSNMYGGSYILLITLDYSKESVLHV